MSGKRTRFNISTGLKTILLALPQVSNMNHRRGWRMLQVAFLIPVEGFSNTYRYRF